MFIRGIQTMPFRKPFGLAMALILVAVLTMSGCVDNSNGSGTAPNSNSSNEPSNPAASTGSTGGSTGTTRTASNQPSLALEPNSYSETITVDVQPTGTVQNTTVPPLQFSFAKMGADRRASFQLPTVGDVVYLEHGGQKYVEFPGRNSYAVLDEETLGVKIPNLSLMSPADVIARIRNHTQFQDLGPADMDGHPAEKYGFANSVNTSTTAGTIATNSTVFIDQATGLPLRAEIIGNSSNGAGARIMLETRNLDLNPQASLFDVPSNMKKVTGQEVRDEIRNLAATLTLITTALQWQPNAGANASPSPDLGAVGTPTPGRQP